MMIQATLRALPAALAALLAMPPTALAGPYGESDRLPRQERRERHAPAVIVEPRLDLARPQRPVRDAPDQVMADVTQCADAGVRLFVDCLRGRHGPVTIRRLEACVASETIPDDLGRVSACLPPARLP